MFADARNGLMFFIDNLRLVLPSPHFGFAGGRKPCYQSNSQL